MRPAGSPGAPDTPPARGGWPVLARVLAVLVLAVVPVGVPPAPPAAAASPCVALVVDRSPGNYGTTCVTWSAGLTGLGVLARGGHPVQFRQDGLVCKIDGYPGGACRADATHYWSYWHRSPGSSGWTYSNSGPASYQPAVGASEGWAYQDGASRQPANVSFPAICPPPRTTPPRTSSPPPPAPPIANRTPTTAARPPVGAPAATTSAGPAGPGDPGGPGGPGGTSARPGRPPRPPGPTRAATAATATGPAATPAPAGSDPPSTAPAAAVGEPGSGAGSGGSPAGVIAGLALVGAVGGAGLWFARSRRGTG